MVATSTVFLGLFFMHRAYQRGLLRQLEKMNEALAQNDKEELQKVLRELIEDTKANIAAD